MEGKVFKRAKALLHRLLVAQDTLKVRRTVDSYIYQRIALVACNRTSFALVLDRLTARASGAVTGNASAAEFLSIATAPKISPSRS